jgi:hypothetical protein
MNPRNKGRFQTQTGGTDGDVRRAAADRLGETRHVLEPPADLLAVEVDRRPADCNHVDVVVRQFRHTVINL